MKHKLLTLLLVLLLATPALAAPQGDVAYASDQMVDVDGTPVAFRMYALKDEYGFDMNYVKLRDIAQLLNGTSAQFNVTWDGAINIVTGQAYVPNGSEMKDPFGGADWPYAFSATETRVNGRAVDMGAILLTDAEDGGFTYYRLRDLGTALGFTVDWSETRGVYVETAGAGTAVRPANGAEPVSLTTQQYTLSSGTVSANVVTVDMADPRVTVKAALPDGLLNNTCDFQTVAQTSGAQVVINANFFNSGSAVKDPVGHLMIDGRMVYGSSGRSSLAITTDNKAAIGRPGLFYRIETCDAGSGLWWDAFEVNQLAQMAYQAVLYTPARGASAPVTYPGYVMTVWGDKIANYVSVSAGDTIAIPANGYAVYFSQETASTDWHAAPEVGRTVKVEPYLQTDNGEPFSMDNVVTMVSGAPRLVRSGAIETYEEPEVTADAGRFGYGSSSRTAVGIKADGTLLLVNCPSATIQQMRELMLQLGCTEAINLDGGASTGLYYDGQFLSTPGRQITSTLQIFVAE